MNSVQNLFKKPFHSCTLEEKLEIKRLGRPTPDLKLEQVTKTKSRTFTRRFNADIYKKNEWICGCNTKNAFFCFPCLLFTGEFAWCQSGITDLNHLSERIKKHGISVSHMNNILNLAVLGKINIRSQLDSGYRRTIEAHNERVSNNRYVLNILINCIRFCGSFELALRGHDESSDSLNPGIFRGLVDFSAELDEALRGHLEKATVFKGTSKTIQNELLQSMLEVCHEEITREIKECNYLAVIADETTDISAIFQMVIVYRYIVNARPVERFWGFVNPSAHDAASLTKTIMQEIDRHVENEPTKLIAQAYDGASVMSGTLSGVQTRVKQKYPNAHYIHCHAHQLNLIMSNAASINRHVRIFFANLGGFCSFFSHSPQRTAILDDVVGKRLPRACPTRWNFHSRTVNTVFEYKEELIECMETIENRQDIKQQQTIVQASGLKRTLLDNDFIFWLTFFHKIMPHVDILFNKLQKRETDILEIDKEINSFEKEISKIRHTCNETSESVEQEGTRKRRHEENRQNMVREAKEVCDVIISEAKNRFSFKGHLIAANLFLSEKFAEYAKSFPEKYLKQTVEAYPILDARKLQTELNLIYGRDEFRCLSGALPLLSFLLGNNLMSTFSESVKLLKILITLPMTTSEAERCFSTLKRVKTFLRSTMLQDRLSALAMLSIEREFIQNITDFNNKVIENFSRAKPRRMDFLYKTF